MTITLILIGITAAVSIFAWNQPGWMERLIYWPPAVARGEWWRLISHGFIHADGTHLAFNMITLYFFGTVMEQVLIGRIGALGFVGFYLGGIVLAMLPSHFYHRNDPNYRSLGASGAVSAVLFAFILLQPWAMLLVFFVPAPAIVFAAVYLAYSVWAGRQRHGNINHAAHLAGAAWGVAFLLLLEPRLLTRFFRELLSPPWL